MWLAGLLSATGIGVLRDVAHNLVLSGGGLAGFVLLIALWACAVCQSLGFYLMHRQVRRARPEPGTAAPATAGVLVLGGAAMIALNTVLVSGEGFLPAFGPVSLIVLCSPYPIVFTLLTARRPVALAAALATAAAVGTTVLPLRSSQEHLVAGAWRTAHPSTPRSLVAAVDWPGGEQSALTARAFGTQVTVFFQDSTVDGSPDGVVTVSPAGTDPCRNVPVVVTYDTVPDQDRLPDGDTMIVARTGCTPAGRGAWWLAGTGFRGYAVVVEGVLVRVTVDDLRPDDDLAAVARSVHPLDDHQLWRYTGGWPGWVWVLT
ncbi:hypothetical protein [Streptomyces sp. NPDC020917]|uniref:hypothetical protein n=1 Tax=Streptomyces sp. NPDC020917 TaxID=3365102 RepID=UPI0037B7DEFE